MTAAAQLLWQASEVAAATRGDAHGTFAATGVSIDSRTLRPGDLFIALRGPHFDGHQFVADALAKGAAGAVVSVPPERFASGAPLVVVADTFTALGDLGRAARGRTRARIIAVTGSVGKTGTKEALRRALGAQAPTAASEGSLNNHWGVPLSLSRMARDARFAVFEMGMNHPGEIAPLSRLARPHVALITTVEAVHSAHFASIDEIADAKAEIFAGVEEHGAAVLNRDNPYYDRLAAAARARGIATILGFGAHAQATVRLLDATIGADGSDVTADVAGRRLTYRLGLAGRHWVLNSLGVLAAVGAAGADIVAAAEAMAALAPADGRGRRHRVNLDGGSLLVIDESYNASPISMRAAIAVLGSIEPGPGGRRIAVLGDMLELGESAAAEHAALAQPLVAAGVDLVFTAGPHMAALRDRLPRARRGAHAENSEKLVPAVVAVTRPGDVVTVKGSAGSRTGQIVRALLALEAGEAGGRRARAANGK